MCYFTSMTTAKRKSKTTAATKKVATTKKAASIVEDEIKYQIGIRELRQDASRVFALVEAGASFTITNHGRVVGTINPPEKTQLEKWVEEGAVTTPTVKLDLRNWKPTQQDGTPDLLDLLLKERREARY